MKPSKTQNIYVDNHSGPLRINQTEFKGRIVKNKKLSIDHPQIKQQQISNTQKQLNHRNQQNQQVKNPQKEDYSSKKKSQNLFTQTYRKKLQIKLFEIEQRKKQLNALSLQKQMAARLNRKINERVHLQQKIDMIKDLQEKRELMLAQKKHKQKRMKEEQQLLHESNLINVEMVRKNRVKSQKKELKQSKCAEKQSWHNLKFKDYLSTKQKEQVRWMITSHLQFRTNKSQSKVTQGQLSTRKHRFSLKKIERPSKTSHRARINEQGQQQNIQRQQFTTNCQNKQVQQERQGQSNINVRVSNQTQLNCGKEMERQVEAKKIYVNMN